MTLMSFFVVLAGTVALFVIIPKGFVPDQDTDQLQITTEAIQGTSFIQMSEYQKKVSEIVNADPGCRIASYYRRRSYSFRSRRSKHRTIGCPSEAAQRAQASGG